MKTIDMIPIFIETKQKVDDCIDNFFSYANNYREWGEELTNELSEILRYAKITRDMKFQLLARAYTRLYDRIQIKTDDDQLEILDF